MTEYSRMVMLLCMCRDKMLFYCGKGQVSIIHDMYTPMDIRLGVKVQVNF